MNHYKMIKKTNAHRETEIENVKGMTDDYGNIYEVINIIAKRANQIQVNLKEEFNSKKEEFITYTDATEEYQENPELIEASRAYEQLPTSVNVAKKELVTDELLYRYQDEEDDLDLNTAAFERDDDKKE